MTVLDLTTAFTGDDLLAACAALGVRRPVGLAESMARHPSAGSPRAVPVLGPVTVSDNTAAALAALAAPEAIAVVERVVAGRTRVTYVAVRGPWAAVHRIHGDHHVVESVDAEDANDELLAAAGLDAGSPHAPRVHPVSFEPDKSRHVTSGNAPVDVTRGAFDRMTELVATNDLDRATAALVGDGAEPVTARSIVAATRADAVHVLGLRSLGLRYEGCELSWVGDAARWLVPLPCRSADTGAVLRRCAGPRHVRVRIEPVTNGWLAEELTILFD